MTNFNKDSTSSTQAKSILTSTDLMKSLYNDQDMIDPSGEQECLQQEIEYEVKAYLKFKVKADDTDILKWWKDHNDNFPNLYTLSKQYLCIPASSTSSERAFSIANNIVTKRRN